MANEKHMVKLLYVTDGIFPETIGGMQKVSYQHIEMLSLKYDLYVIYSGKKIESPLNNVTYINEAWPKVSKFWFVLKYVKQLKEFSKKVFYYIENINPDIIYSEGPLIDKVINEKKNINPPVIFHPHGLEPFQNKASIIENLKSKLLCSIIKRHCLLANVVLCQGGELMKILTEKINVPSEEIECIGNVFSGGEEEKKYQVDIALDVKKYDLIFVGRNEKRKGLSFFLKTIEKLSKSIKICIVGDHDIAYKRYKSKHDIYWAGEIVESNTLYSLYKKSKFFVLPSFAEGMPTVLIEAMSFGVPVIAAKVGAVSEVVKIGKNGFLFEKGDSRAMLSSIQEAFQLSNDEYKKYAVLSKKRVIEKHSFDVIKKRLIQIIEKTLAVRRYSL